MEWVSAEDRCPAGFRLNRLEAIEQALQRFHDGLALLPIDARALGGRMRAGHGEYYRELQAPLEATRQPGPPAGELARVQQLDTLLHSADACCRAVGATLTVLSAI